MRVPRFSLAGLMLAVLGAGVGLAALRFASPLWASALHSILLALLLASVLGVCLRKGRARAGWLGFGVFGWGYLLLGLTPWFGTEAPPPALLTAGFVDVLHESLFPAPPAQNMGWVEQIQLAQGSAPNQQIQVIAANPMQSTTAAQLGWGSPATTNTYVVLDTGSSSNAPAGKAFNWIARLTGTQKRTPDLTSFRQVGSSVAAFATALMGGFLGRVFFSRERRGERAPGVTAARPAIPEAPSPPVPAI